MSWAAIVVGVVSVGAGVYQKSRANKQTKEALKNRKAFTTPKEYYQMLNALQSRAQGDTQARDFQTQQLDNVFANQLGVSELLGADPNDLSALFNQKMQGILQTGQQFHASNMEAFGKYLGGLEAIGQNKAAEWGWEDNRTKDLLAALNQQKQDANKTINSGINLGMSGIAALSANNLYGEDNYTLPPPSSLSNNGQVITTTPPPTRTTGTAAGTIVPRTR